MNAPKTEDQIVVARDYHNITHVSNVNYERCLRWHPAGIDSWSLADWAVALAGETGELCNVVKKLNRVRDGLTGNKETKEQLISALRAEAADIYLYLDLFCQRVGFDLAEAVRDKFNSVSMRNGFPERL
jgi:NTP pyrophosphatase (non-canonical NTP hydrolase)